MMGRNFARCFSFYASRVDLNSESVDGRTHLIDRHELLSSVCLCFRQWHELDVLWRTCFVVEGRRNRVEVVSADSDELPASTNVLVQLVLEINERCV